MNFEFIAIYFLSFYLLSKKRKMYLIAGLVFLSILGCKIYFLASSTAVIESELIGPTALTEQGEYAFSKLINEKTAKNKSSECPGHGSCKSVMDEFNSLLLVKTSDLINKIPLEQKLNAIEWIKSNGFYASEMPAIRGRYLHHYNTVLFPLREFKSGNFGALLTSQYGMISLLPFLLPVNTSFLYYGILGLTLILFAGLALIYKFRDSYKDLLIIFTLSVTISLLTNVGAIRLSPGFSFLRYFPILCLLGIVNIQFKSYKNIYYFFVMALALLNSIQFNILFLAIYLLSISIVSLKEFKFPVSQRLYIPAIVSCITIFQIFLQAFESNSFSPTLFGSVGEGGLSRLYTIGVLSFPILVEIINLASKNYKITIFDGVNFSDQDIFNYVAYALCATYAISFAGSPQHYVGFVLMAFISIFLILKKISYSLSKLVIGVLIFLAIPIYFFYPYSYGLGEKFKPYMPNYLSFNERFGKNIYFASDIKIDVINSDYINLVKKYENSKIYFISKDKIYIETYSDVNLEPKSYDVFVNYVNVPPEIALKKFKHDGVKYVVLDSPIKRLISKSLLELYGSSIGSGEYLGHMKIIESIDELSKSLKPNLLECNDRYCIYSI